MRTEIFTCYSPEADITFIMEDTIDGMELIATEVKGFYYGEADENCTKIFYGKLKADFTLD